MAASEWQRRLRPRESSEGNLAGCLKDLVADKSVLGVFEDLLVFCFSPPTWQRAGSSSGRKVPCLAALQHQLDLTPSTEQQTLRK